MPFLSPNQQRQSTDGHTNSTNPTVISFAQTTCHSTRNKHKANDVSGSRMSVTSTAADVLISHIEQTDNTAVTTVTVHQTHTSMSTSRVSVTCPLCTIHLLHTGFVFNSGFLCWTLVCNTQCPLSQLMNSNITHTTCTPRAHSDSVI